MALTLSAKVGDDIFFNERRFIVTSLFDEICFTLAEDAPDAETFSVTDKEAVEILPDVFVSAGDLFQLGIIRVVIEAPREVVILRGDIKRHPEAHRARA